LGNQPYQFRAEVQHFGDILCLHHQDLLLWTDAADHTKKILLFLVTVKTLILILYTILFTSALEFPARGHTDQ
jgi:hypothetical protein